MTFFEGNMLINDDLSEILVSIKILKPKLQICLHHNLATVNSAREKYFLEDADVACRER